MTNDLNAVAVFLKVVELGSFRGAAQALRLPRSTVSLRVAQLEDGLGARLLERTTRALRLTEAGRAYQRQVGPALEAVELAGRAVADLEAEPSGSLRLTAPVELGQVLFGGVLAEYLRRCPGVKLDVELTDRRVDLVEEGFDLALRAGALADSTLVVRKLGAPKRMLLCASPAYLARRGRPRRPADLVRHDCLVMSGARTATSWPFVVRGKPVLVEVTPRVAVNSLRVVRDLTLAGHGIARLPEQLTERARASGALRVVLAAHVGPGLPLHALYPSARHVSPKLRVLIEVLEQQIAAGLTMEP